MPPPGKIDLAEAPLSPFLDGAASDEDDVEERGELGGGATSLLEGSSKSRPSWLYGGKTAELSLMAAAASGDVGVGGGEEWSWWISSGDSMSSQSSMAPSGSASILPSGPTEVF